MQSNKTLLQKTFPRWRTNDHGGSVGLPYNQMSKSVIVEKKKSKLPNLNKTFNNEPLEGALQCHEPNSNSLTVVSFLKQMVDSTRSHPNL